MEENHNGNRLSSQDRFSRFMFGSRDEGDQIENQPEEEGPQPSLDYEEMWNHIDTLITSTKGLKPLFKRVYPYIERLWKDK